MKNALMNLRRLRHVVSLSQHGSFVRAADALNLSTSALSRSIQTTEAEFGGTIFHRGRGGVHATPAGQRFISAASALLERAAELQSFSLAFESPALSEVSFGIGPVPASFMLKEILLSALERRNKRIQVEVLSGQKLLDRLNSSAIEFFVCAQASVPPAPHISCEILGTLPLGRFARPDHPLASRSQISREELERYPEIGGVFSPSKQNLELLRLNMPYKPLVSCDDYLLLASVVSVSDATCTFPLAFTEHGLTKLNCAQEAEAPQFTMVLCRPRFSSLSAAAAATIEEIRTIAKSIDRP